MVDHLIRSSLKSMSPKQVEELVNGLVGIILFRPEVVGEVQDNLSKASPDHLESLSKAIDWMNNLAEEAYKIASTLN